MQPTLGRKKLTEVGVDDVAKLIVKLEREGLAAWTVRGVLVVLGRIYATAERAGLVNSNPVRKLDRGERPSVPKTERRIPTEEEAAKLLKVGGSFRVLIAVGLFAGLRLSEALALQWESIDFEQGRINVTH